MSTRAMRKLQGGRGDLDLPNSCPEEEGDEDQETEETQIVPSKGQNRFDLLIQGSPSESEVKEDDDLTETGEGRDDVQRDGTSPQPPIGSGVKRKRRKKKKRGRARVPASSEDPTDNDKDEIDNIIQEVNAISGETHIQASIEKNTRKACKTSWFYLRDQYRQTLKNQKTVSGQAAGKKRKWKYEDQMSFLKPFLQERHTVSNISDDPDTPLDNDLPEDDIADNSEISVVSEVSWDEAETTSHEEGENVTAEIIRQQQETTTHAHDKVRRCVSRLSTAGGRTQVPTAESSSSILMKYILDQKDASREKDHIDNFLSGIAATMKSFPPLYQHVAKSRIFNVVSEIALEVLMKTQTSSVEPVPKTSQELHNLVLLAHFSGSESSENQPEL